jgi:hypothetical protein
MAIHVSMFSFCRAFQCGNALQLFHAANFRIGTAQIRICLFPDFRVHRLTTGSGFYTRYISCAVTQNSIGGDENSKSADTEPAPRTPRALREEEWQAAQSFITPELKAKYTLSDGSIDFKAISKLIPLQVDNGPLDVVYEDEDLIAVR